MRIEIVRMLHSFLADPVELGLSMGKWQPSKDRDASLLGQNLLPQQNVALVACCRPRSPDSSGYVHWHLQIPY